MEDGLDLMTLATVTRDCADSLALAAFYGRATALEPVEGCRPTTSRACSAPVVSSWGSSGCRTTAPPIWPGQHEPQQAHLGFEVDDLDLVSREPEATSVQTRAQPAATSASSCSAGSCSAVETRA